MRADDRKGGLGTAGFTIVETMIVLAVTGGLFVAIAVTLSGRQNAAEFSHSIQSAQSRIQQVIDQVSAGFYPNNGDFTCMAAGGNVQFGGSSSSQGTNQDCVFLGKVIQFGVHGTDPEQYNVYTVAGLRGYGTGATSPFQNVSPAVVGVGSNYTGYSLSGTLEYGLTTLWVKSNGTDVGAVGFLMEPGTLDSTTGSYASGGQQIDLVPLPGTSLNQTINSTAAAIDNRLQDPNLTADAPINPPGGVQICLVSGATNQSGLITIGGSGRQLLVKLDIKNNGTCT
jgi:type II secretory pathway pseudopilin PulG